jgi:hypothetical protein
MLVVAAVGDGPRLRLKASKPLQINALRIDFQRVRSWSGDHPDLGSASLPVQTAAQASDIGVNTTARLRRCIAIPEPVDQSFDGHRFPYG